MKKHQAPEGYLTIADVSDTLNVHRNTVQGWIATGKIAHIKPSAQYFVPVTEMDRIMSVKVGTTTQASE